MTTIFARLAGWCSYLAPAVHECSLISQDYRTSITKVFMTLFLKKGGAIAPLAPPGYATDITQYGSTVYIYRDWFCIIAIHKSFTFNLSSKDIKVENM